MSLASQDTARFVQATNLHVGHACLFNSNVYYNMTCPCNTWLHVGFDHRTKRGPVQAMFVSFGMAEAQCGECILRFDDTNPEAEKKEYIDHIQEIVSWMGWTPAKVTSSLAPKAGVFAQITTSLCHRAACFCKCTCSVLRSRIVERHACQHHDLALNHVQGTQCKHSLCSTQQFLCR